MGYRACLELLSLSRKYGKERLGAACQRALVIGSPTRRSVMSILESGLDRQPILPIPLTDWHSLDHENVRMPEYYHGPKEVAMLMQQTLPQLKSLKLDGMARAFEEQAALTASTSLSFEERFGLVVERELAWRDTRRLERLLKSAKLKNPQACIEDIEYRQSRGIDKSIVAALAGCDWIRNAQNLILRGPSGARKT